MHLMFGFGRHSARSAASAPSADQPRATSLVTILALLLILDFVAIVLSLGIWIRQIEINPTLILPDEGHAYVVANIPGQPGFPFAVRGEGLGTWDVSSLRVHENGTPLGPAHSLHADIRTLGGGAFSHWGNALYFSASDSSDPRTNGRRYSIAFAVTFHYLATALFALVTVAMIFFERRYLAAWLPKHGDKVLAAGALSIGFLLALISAGALPPLNASAGPPKDWSLGLGIVLHLGVGAALFAGVAATSIGCAMLVLRRRDVAPSEAVLVGYCPALVMIVAFAVIAIAVPSGRWLSGLLLIATWLPLVAWRPSMADLSALGIVVSRCAAPAVGLAVFMALLWHGPTATLSASTQGDLIHSLAAIHMLAVHPYPLWHFASEGDFIPYGNMAPMVVGAALMVIPGFDGMLFLTASLGLFYGMWLALGFAAVRAPTDSDPKAKLGMLGIAVVIALALAGVRTPTYVVESPPVAFALPLLFSISFLARNARSEFVPSLLTAIAAGVGTALSKVVLLVPLSLLSSVDALVGTKKRSALTPWQGVLLLTAALAIGSYVVQLLVTWAPPYLSLFVPGPDSRIWFFNYGSRDPFILAVVLARDIGWCMVGMAVVRMGVPRLTMAYWAAILSNFAYPYLFSPAPVCAVLLVAIAIVMQPELFARTRNLLAAGVVLLLPYPLTRDWAGTQTGIVWVMCIAPLTWLAISPLRPIGALARWTAARIAPVSAAAVGAGLVAVSSGLVIVDSQWSRGPADVLTPAMYDMWSQVRRTTPSDALIFTDLTGPEFRVASGWNSYAATGERQVYLASWVTSFSRFRVDPVARAQRLILNEKVLAGELNPADLALARKYGAYFAVMRNDHRAPTNFVRIYQNKDLTLYRIEPAH